jgi:hypothetical protein
MRGPRMSLCVNGWFVGHQACLVRHFPPGFRFDLPGPRPRRTQTAFAPIRLIDRRDARLDRFASAETPGRQVAEEIAHAPTISR